VGSGSATSAGLATASSVTVVGSAGIWLWLPPLHCAATVIVATTTSPSVSYSGSILHFYTLWYHEHQAMPILCSVFVLYGSYLFNFSPFNLLLWKLYLDRIVASLWLR
jgi:hypothetical protein